MKLLLTFVITFMATYGSIHIIQDQISSNQRRVDQEETKIIQQEIKDRFDLFLDVSLVIGQISSEYLNTKTNPDFDYGKIVEKIFREKNYMLGLNRLDNRGEIIKVYPHSSNMTAKGKITQNYQELIASFKRNEAFWFSPPFKLYQDGYGFVLYVPIIRQQELLGWIAPVISSQLFFESFRTLKFFTKYDLVIKDEKTGLEYFSTGTIPDQKFIFEANCDIKGRKIIFQSWRKTEKPLFTFSLFWLFFTCTFIASFASFAMKLQIQRKKALMRLKSISILLQMSSKEALNKLMDIQEEYSRTNEIIEKDVTSVTNLIEQIDLLQNMAESETIEKENFYLLPMIKNQIEDQKEIILKKGIDVELDEESFGQIKVTGNKWLISNTVLKNALMHALLSSLPSQKITILFTNIQDKKCIVFNVKKVYDAQTVESFKIERRLLVARHTMALLNGEIEIDLNGFGEMTLRITFDPEFLENSP